MSDHVTTDESIFVPRYDYKHYVALIAGPIMLVTTVWLATVTDRNRLGLYLCAAFFGLCTVVLFVKPVRRIRFGARISVHRYVLRPREFEYADILDIGVMSIKTKRGSISLYQMKNADELYSLFEEAMRRGALSEEQVAGTLATHEVLSWAAASYAAVPSIVVAVVLVWASPIPLNMDGRLSFLLYWIPIYCFAYLIAKRIISRESA